MGGLARKAYVIDGVASQNFQVLITDAGNLFFSKDVISPGVTLDLAKGTANIIRDCFNEIGCNAFSPGSQDFAAGIDFLQRLQNGANFDFISANICALSCKLSLNTSSS